MRLDKNHPDVIEMLDSCMSPGECYKRYGGDMQMVSEYEKTIRARVMAGELNMKLAVFVLDEFREYIADPDRAE